MEFSLVSFLLYFYLVYYFICGLFNLAFIALIMHHPEVK
jgi:hypothetical protein